MADSKGNGKKGATIHVKTEDDHDKLSSSGSSGSSPDGTVDAYSTEQIGTGVATGSIHIDREEYLQAHRNLVFERNQLQIKNNILNKRLVEYYKKRRLEHVLKPVESNQDLEEKYQQKLITYEDLKDKEEREMNDIKGKLLAVETQYREKLDHTHKIFDDLQQLERSTGIGLIYSKKGKPIADKTVDRFLMLQRRKSQQCSDLRLRFIRVRNLVTELEAIVRRLEMLGPGLYVAHYEQLYIDNENYVGKIEEREDELIKNRAKCTEHNMILAHIREKMNHTDEVIDFTECDLGDAEMELLRAREDMTIVKGRRDKLRWSLQGERMKAGLLTRRDLLRDYQDAADLVIELREKKEHLEQQINATTAQLRETRRRMQIKSDDEGTLIERPSVATARAATE